MTDKTEEGVSTTPTQPTTVSASPIPVSNDISAIFTKQQTTEERRRQEDEAWKARQAQKQGGKQHHQQKQPNRPVNVNWDRVEQMVGTEEEWKEKQAQKQASKTPGSPHQRPHLPSKKSVDDAIRVIEGFRDVCRHQMDLGYWATVDFPSKHHINRILGLQDGYRTRSDLIQEYGEGLTRHIYELVPVVKAYVGFVKEYGMEVASGSN